MVRRPILPALVLLSLVSLPAVALAQVQTITETEKLAEREFQEGERVETESAKVSFKQAWELTAESYRRAIDHFSKARDHYRQLGSGEKEATSLIRIGRLEGYLNNLPKAFERYKEAAEIYQRINKPVEVARTKTSIGFLFFNDKKTGPAKIYFTEALTAARLAHDSVVEEIALSGLGDCFGYLSQDRKKAIEHWLLAAKAAEATGDDYNHATNLRKIAMAYSEQGERQLALGYYSLALQRVVKVRTGAGGLLEAYARQGVALQYSELGEYRKAINFDLEAVGLLEDVGMTRLVADALLRVSVGYSNLRESAEAMKYARRALETYQAVKSLHGEATAQENIGKLYLFDFKNYAKAQESFERSLAIARELKNPGLQAKALSSIGDVFYFQGDTSGKDIEYRRKAYDQYKEAKDLLGLADTVFQLGLSYHYAGDRKQACVQFNISLMMYSFLDRRADRLKPFAYLAIVWERAGDLKLATFYAKIAVAEYQKIRHAIRGLPSTAQRNYLNKIDSDYRRLARLLMKQGRLREAHQVLVALKDEQSLDATRFEDKSHQINLALTGRELEFLQPYRDWQTELDKIRVRSAELGRLKLEGTVTQEQLAESGQVSQKMGELFQGLVDKVEAAAADFSKPDGKPEFLPEIAENTSMRNALATISTQTEQPTVAVYQLAGENELDSLIVTATEIKHVSVQAKGLGQTARTYWALLQSDLYDPRTVGKALHDVVFKPLEKELPPGTKTILWSQDGNLRYVPMAALFDGKRYLIERFNHVTLTRADSERLTKPVSSQWTASGFGSSKAHTVRNLDKVTSFNALPGVSAELNSLFEKANRKNVLDGEVLLDQSFTRKNLLDKLAQQRPVVHIASHFSFRPGDDSNSFLLLGDGTALTLADMKSQKGLFTGVELLTLSACNTAAQQADATGYEVDAFFQLAQRLGAQSVLATLWPVADSSTPWLMREFYDLKVNKKQNKAEALRNAQLALLKGSAKARRSATRSDASMVKIVVVDGSKQQPGTGVSTRADVYEIGQADARPFVADSSRPFAHPFYWSPFVLIGNWR